ncbi:MAG: integrin alpha, partial [Gammaproteobacteria bacterium]
MTTMRFALSLVIGIASVSTTVSAAGVVRADFNGDGFEDVAIGVPDQDSPNASDAGAVQILYGDPQGLIATGIQVLDLTNCPFSDEGNRFGSALAAGDFDGDNFTDLAIGLPFADVSGVQDAGAVLIVYGTGVGLVCNNGTA